MEKCYTLLMTVVFFSMNQVFVTGRYFLLEFLFFILILFHLNLNYFICLEQEIPSWQRSDRDFFFKTKQIRRGEKVAVLVHVQQNTFIHLVL